MYDPCTLAFSIRRPWKSRGGYRPSWIDIWHVDPERPNTGNRTDDSCGWFQRGPKEYADAVAWLLKDKDFVFELGTIFARRVPVTGAYGYTFPRLCHADTLAATLMTAVYLERRRWWNGSDGNGGAHRSIWRRALTKERSVAAEAIDLALNPIDNLSSVDSVERMVLLIAAALHRRHRAWWSHPRWHVHHWQLRFPGLQPYWRWLFGPRCATCHGRIGPGKECPVWDGRGLHHGACLHIGIAGAKKWLSTDTATPPFKKPTASK